MIETVRLPMTQLLSQPQDNQIICSACSGYNFLKLAGTQISYSEGQSLIQQVLHTRRPLNDQDLIQLAARYGLEMAQLQDNARYSEIDYLVNDFIKILHQSPVFFRVSTLLSKRDPSVIPTLRSQDLIDPKKLIMHAVVAVQDIQSQVLIIDPYDVMNPEVFNTNKAPDRLNLAAWLTSGYFADRLINDTSATKNNLLSLAHTDLSRQQTVENDHVTLLGLSYAKPRYLKQS